MTTRAYRGRAGQDRKGFYWSAATDGRIHRNYESLEEAWVSDVGDQSFAATGPAEQEQGELAT